MRATRTWTCTRRAEARGAAARALALALAGALAACTSTDRLWRISPVADGEASSERVNLWPLAYHEDDATSVLWPIFDVDGDGFAVRPLLSHDETRWSVLWPLSSWDTATGEGWALLYYDAQENRGVFPLANLGTWSWVTLAWWKKDDAGLVEASGLFPLATFTPGYSHVGTVWWSNDRESWGVFPLYGRRLLGVDHVGPAWWSSDAGERDFGLLPVFHYADGGNELAVLPLYAHWLREDESTRYWLMGLGRTHRTKGTKRDWVLPLWYDHERKGAEDEVLFPFYYRRERGDAKYVFTLFGDRREAPEGGGLNVYPLWWSSRAGDASWKMLLPFFYWSDDGGERSLVTPLGGRGWSATGATRYTNVLGPLYHRSRKEDGSESRTAFLWPLFERHRVEDETTTRALPFFAHASSPEESETWYALGLGHGLRSEDASGWRLWPLAAVSRGEEEPDLFYRLSLFTRRVDGDTRKTRLFPLYASERGPDGVSRDLLLGLAHQERGDDVRGWHVWPLASSYEGEDHLGLGSLTLFGRSRWEGGRSVHVGTPLLYSSSRHEGPGERERSTRLLTVFSHEVGEWEDGHVPGSHPVRSAVVARESYGFLFGIFANERTRRRVWEPDLLTEEQADELHRWSGRYDDVPVLVDLRDPEATVAVLEEKEALPPGTEAGDPDAVRAAVHAFAREHTVEVDEHEVRLPLLFHYERKDDALSWSGPLWIAQHERDAESSETSVLWYGYRSKTRDGKTSRDIFPFLTWDTGPEEKTISFLWRLFRYERKGEERGGYVLFVPWGDV